MYNCITVYCRFVVGEFRIVMKYTYTYMYEKRICPEVHYFVQITLAYWSDVISLVPFQQRSVYETTAKANGT